MATLECISSYLQFPPCVHAPAPLSPLAPPTESWVKVKGEEPLEHSHSKEKMEELLVAAASEEELSDTEQQR